MGSMLDGSERNRVSRSEKTERPLSHSKFIGLREDKQAKDVVRERALSRDDY
jgi:hypothetical protein